MQALDDRLFAFQRLCRLPGAEKEMLQQLRVHLAEEDKGAGFLQGLELQVYEAFNDDDLSSIIACDQQDFFTNIARGPYVDMIHRFMRKQRKTTIDLPKVTNINPFDNETVSFFFKDYPNDRLVTLARVLYALVTSILVTAAIISLNKAKNTTWRIVLIAVHNFLFIVLMAYFTKSRPGEIFAVAAGYAAVLVVFASGPQ